MIRNKLKYLALTLSSTLLVSCNGIDNNQTIIESTDESADTTAEVSSDTDAENTESTEKSGNEAGDFYSVKLDVDDEKSIDLGNDGNMDSLVLTYGTTDWGETYTLKTNDKTLDLITEEETNLCEDVDTYFVHKSTGDYLLASRSGFSNIVDVVLYKWDNGSFVEKDRLKDMAISNDAESISENNLVAYSYCTAFGNWDLCKNYSYGDTGFSTEDKMSKVRPGYGGSKELTLKKSLTLNDEKGNPTKTLDAGQKIIPSEANDTYEVGAKNTMSFVSEDGELLGYITYEYVSDGETEFPSSVTVDGVSEDELFENIEHVG
ncbi:MAG: hypothetical protein J5802_13485 [Butyrivibrio sp.]|nr:hypothetical protein [Butyrivibrio sp.]